MIYKPQEECPALERYKKVFPIEFGTIIAYDKVIYSNFKLPIHLEIHERRHLIRQQKMGLDIWVTNYLENPLFMLKEEVLAYREQVDSIKDRNERDILRRQCAKDLSSKLYNNIVTYQEAYNLLVH